MAILSDYTSGTISLAQGSVTVTGTGTLFEVTRFREGDTLQIQNLTAVIASVNSDTSLTLTEPWTGSTIVDGPYRARQLGDISRYPTQAATIIDLLGNGVLTNIAEIPVEEGKLLRGNAAGQYEAVPEDEIGIQDPNGSLAKLAALSLAARQIMQTDETGALKTLALAANKFLRTDANGDLDLSDLTALGVSLLGLTGTNGNIPVMTGAGTVASRPIVGTVSQSSGVPTGAIAERGSNSNGSWMRFANGLQICCSEVVDFTGTGAGIRTGVWAFPASFSSIPVVMPPVPANFGDSFEGVGLTDAATTTTAPAIAIRVTASGAGTIPVRFVAIGEWFS